MPFVFIDLETLEPATDGQISTRSGARPRSNGDEGILHTQDTQTGVVFCQIIHGLDGLMPQAIREANVQVLKDLLRPLNLHLLDHRRVMKCYGYLLEAPSFYVVNANQYRWAPLIDVARGLTDGGKLDLLRKAAESVAYLHSRTPPIVHCHVEPSQFAVSPNRQDVVLRNFGLKHRLHYLAIPESGISMSGVERNVGYSLGYSSPAYLTAFEDELRFGPTYQPITADDVFTFAGTILKVMSGSGPYERRKGPNALVSAVKGKPPSYDQHPTLPANDSIWSLLLRMWDADPLKRPSMEEVLEAECQGRGGPEPPPVIHLSVPGGNPNVPTDILAEEIPEGRIFYAPDPATWSGVYSDVYKAWYTLPNQVIVAVAVKKLRGFNADSQALKQQLLRRLAREAKIWIGLNHEYILKLHGYQASPEPVLISPWSDTGNLRKFLFAGLPILMDFRLRLIVQVALGVNYLHQREPDAIIHGDIKPENVVIGPQGQAWLCDFGLARIHQGSTGHTDHVGATGTGTQGYRAPELVDPWTQDKPTDIWALGSLMVTCLSLREPWDEVDKHRKWNEAILGNYPRRDEHPGLPADSPVWNLIELCWKQKAAERPSSVEVVSTLALEYRKTAGVDEPEIVLSSTKPSPTKEEYFLTLPCISLPELDRLSLTFDHTNPRASGYFARVFKGTLRTALERPQDVAIKVLNDIGMSSSRTEKERTERIAKRMNRESETWGAMNHHNVLPILGVCYGPEPYIVTPWCQNGDLEKFLRDRPLMNLRQKLQLALGAARGLQYLHAFDPAICHGDIKPRNVLVSDNENDTFLCDFGLACGFEKIDAANMTSGLPKGTARFSSPEQVRSGKRTLAGDVYSIGLLILNVLTGLAPFHQHTGASDQRIEFLRTRDPSMIPDLKVYPSWLESDPIWNLMLRCWSLDPQARPAITDVARELECRFKEL